MTDTPTVHVAMGRVLAALPAIGKNQRNQQQGFNFRGIDDVLNALNPLLSEHGLVIVPHRVIERVANQRQTKSGSVMYEVGLHVQYRIYGPAGDFIEAEAWGEGTDSGDKATPKAMTGAYKYMLFEAFSISTEEASKTDADRHTPEPAVRTIDCPEACGHAATKDAMRGHLLDAHGWTRHDDGRVSRPQVPQQGRSDDDATAEGDAARPGESSDGSPGHDRGRDASEPSPTTARAGKGEGPAAGAAPRTSRPTSPAPVPPPPSADNGPNGPTGAGPPAPPGPREEAAAPAHPAAAASPGNVSTAQVRLMHVLLGKLGVGEGDKHRYCTALINLPEPPASLNDLTKSDGRRLIDALQSEAGEPAK